MQKGYFVDMLKHKAPLFEAIYEANIIKDDELFSALNIETQEQELISNLSQNKKVAKLLNKLAYSTKQDSSSLQYWDYADENKRLALLSDEKLQELCFIFGIALHAKEIAQTIEGQALRELEHSLGADIYNYAIMRGQFQLNNVRRYFADLDLDYPLVERAKMHAYQAICLVTQHWSNPFLLKKLQKLKVNLFNEPPKLTDLKLDLEAINEIYFALKKILIKEIDPKWQAYLD